MKVLRQLVRPLMWVLALLLVAGSLVVPAATGGAAANPALAAPAAAGPAAPALLYPTNGSRLDLVAFQWQPVAGAATYQIQVSVLSDFRDTDLDVIMVGTRLVLDEPLRRRAYFWRVAAIGGAGVMGAWSPTWNVTNVWMDPNTGMEARPNNVRWLDVATGQTLPLLAPRTTPCAAYPDPSSAVTCSVYSAPMNETLLVWDAVPGTDHYLVEFGGDATFPRPPDPPPPSPNGYTVYQNRMTPIWWSGTGYINVRVTAVDKLGQHSVSSNLPLAEAPDPTGLVTQLLVGGPVVHDPTLDVTLPAPLLDPPNGTTGPSDPLLRWAAVPGAVGYVVGIFEDNSMATTAVEAAEVSPTDNTVMVAASLLPENSAGKSYRWFVLPCQKDPTKMLIELAQCAARSNVIPLGRWRYFHRLATPLVGLNSGLVNDKWPTLRWTARGTAADTSCAYVPTNPALTGCPTSPQYEVQILDTGQTHLTMANEWVLSELGLVPGTYSWRVRVVGDGNPVPLWSATSTFTVPAPPRYDILQGGTGAAPTAGPTQATQAKLAPTVTLTAAPAAGLRVRTKVKLTAVLDPQRATGKVTFTDSGHTLGTATVRNGRATLTTSRVYGGTQDLVAVYGGSAELRDSTSAAVRVAVADSKKPTLRKLSLVRTASRPRVKWSASDAGGVRTVQVTYWVAPGAKKTTQTPAAAKSMALPAAAKGKRMCVTVRVVDWAGNVSKARTRCGKLR